MVAAADVWAEVVGQPDAIEQLRNSAAQPVHAYMFVGPHGSGRWSAARGFAAEVLSAGLGQEASDRAVRLALRGEHPDLIKIDPTGNEYRRDDVAFLITEASRTPVEGSRKIIVADRFHTANAASVGRLLKTLEEPPESTIIVLLSEHIPDDQVTIASRCLVVNFQAVPLAEVVAWLLDRGLAPDAAETVALASGGDLRRAADLSGDDQVAQRYEAWKNAAAGLDGTGAAVAVLVEQLRAMIDQAQGPIDIRHRAEEEALAQQEEDFGTRGSGRRDLESAHKREIKRLRLDEIRFGLATLAAVYRDRLVADPRKADVRALDTIRDTNEALVRNPNEALLLQALFLGLQPA